MDLDGAKAVLTNRLTSNAYADTMLDKSSNTLKSYPSGMLKVSILT
jgi:hypothetical protein